MPKRPVSGTREWAAHSCNIMVGCAHGCLYCYARASAVRRGLVSQEEEAWGVETLNGNPDKKFGKRTGTTMFPTQHDITPGNLQHAIKVLPHLLEPGNDVLIVSKPHLDCIQELCRVLEPYKAQVLFRFTIGSKSSHRLWFWEPDAPSFSERRDALKHAFEAGFRTSVSMEPMLDFTEDAVVACVDTLDPYVTDTIWLGKANRLEERLRQNGLWNGNVIKAANRLLASQSDERILALYERLQDRPKIHWKDSIKQVVGLDRPTEPGMDV